MKTRQPISQLINLIRRDIGAAEIAALIDQFPSVALLVETDSGYIRMGNSKATELTGYTKSELNGLDLRLMLPDFRSAEKELAEAEQSGSRSLTTTVLSRMGKQIPIEVRIEALGSGSGWSLLAIEPVASQRKRQAEIAIQALRWDALRSLVQSIRQINLLPSFETALESAHHLTGAGILALYRLSGHKTNFVRYAAFGENNALPEEFDGVERTLVHRPTLWTPGKLSSTSLERSAKAAGLKFLLTYPLIDKNTLQGLLVLGDRESNPPDQLMQISQLVADAVTASVETKILINNLYDRIALNEMEIGLGRALNGVVDQGIIVTSKNLLIEDINPAAEQKLGYRREEVIKLHLNKVLIGPPELEDALIAAKDGRPVTDLEMLRIHNRAGRDFPALIKLYPVFDDDKVEALLILFQDQTEWDSLRKMYERLEPRAYKGDRLNEYFHDAQNQVAGITAGVEVLSRRFADDPRNLKIVKSIADESTKLEKRLNSILKSSASGEYHMAPVDIAGLIQEILDAMGYQLTKANVVSEVISSPGIPPVYGDSSKLELVFENLISNAIQAMKDKGGRLTMKIQPTSSLDLDRSAVEIIVSDTGPGIPEELLPQIFGQYFTTSPSHTGLGLSIVQRVVSRHQGSITPENMDGGALFRLVLPAALEGQQSRPTEMQGEQI